MDPDRPLSPAGGADWTPFVWISEAVTNVYEALAMPNFLARLHGTPLLPWALWLFGAKIGRGVYMDTTDLTEFDCVRIGDEAELNPCCGPQTHLFEDRVTKIGRGAELSRGTVPPRGGTCPARPRRRSARTLPQGAGTGVRPGVARPDRLDPRADQPSPSGK
jgi:hypothetical protein